jgi:hypothetical protein
MLEWRVEGCCQTTYSSFKPVPEALVLFQATQLGDLPTRLQPPKDHSLDTICPLSDRDLSLAAET